MNKFKIGIGFFLLYGAGSEYISASKELLTFFDIGIILACLTMLVLCAWLMGSGLSKEKLSIKSFRFVKYFGLTLLVFLFIAFISLFTHKYTPDIVKINGVDVDIAEFMIITRKIIPEETQRREYCICIVNKLTQDKNIADEFKSEFQSGKFSKVIAEIQDDPYFNKLNLNECIGAASSAQWTIEFENGIRASLIKQIRQLNVSKTNDTSKYCDCLMEEYKKIPIKDFTNSDFPQSQKNGSIVSVCDTKSKINPH